MTDVFKLEIKKIKSKKDMMLIMTVLILAPILFSYCIANEVAGIEFGGAVSLGDYGVLIWSFLKYLMVLYLVPIYMAASFLGKEVENRSIQLMLANKERSTVIRAKLIAYALVLTAFFALFQIMCLVSYKLFISGTDLSVEGASTAMSLFFIYLFQWLELMFVLLVSLALCCLIKGNAVLVMGLVVVILERILASFAGIKRILPYHISDYTAYSNISEAKLLTSNICSTIIYLVILSALLLSTVVIWKKRDF